MKVTFLGHRPQDMGGFTPNELQKAIHANIEQILLTNKNYIVLTSLAPGIEMWAGEIAYNLKIKYHVYIPYNNYHAKWPSVVRKQYSSLLKHTSKRIVISDSEYDSKKLLEKDVMMTTDANIIYSFFKEEPPLLKRMIKDGKKVINKLPEEDDYFIKF